MPDTDWLTGLSSRAAFARQVGQADQDREEFAVAIIGLRHIDEINRQLGFDVGDDLLRTVGRALGDRVGVGTTVARLGGARFGMMTVGVGADGVAHWLEPAISAMETAVAGWIFEQIDFNGDHPIEPQLVVGAAGGFSGRVWADAAIALDVCETDRSDGGGSSGGAALAVYDEDNPQFASMRIRETQNEQVLQALGRGSVQWCYQRVERMKQPNPQRPWLRITAVDVDAEALRPVIGIRLERAMVDQAAKTVSEEGGQTRITVPLRWMLTSDRTVDYWLAPSIERHRVPATRLVFEVSEAVVTCGGVRALQMLSDITDLGADLVLADCSGGAATVSVLEAIPVRYLKPAPTLIEQLKSGFAAAEFVLATVGQLAIAAGGEVIIPEGGDTPAANLVSGFRER